MSKATVFCGIVFFILLGIVSVGFADHDEDRKPSKGHHSDKKRSSDHDEESLRPVINAVYKEKCGACHFAYQPALSSSEGWTNILDQPDDHFGESFELNAEEYKDIKGYLQRDAADKSGAEISRKIMKSLDSKTLMRITDIPYIRKKHREISPDVIKRRSAGSLSNCIACHKKAEGGYYDDPDE